MTCDLKDYCKKELEDLCPLSCYWICPSLCKSYSNDRGYDISPPPNHSHSISTNLIIMASVLGSAFLLGISWILILNLYSRWNSSTRVNLNLVRVLSRTDEDFLDENNHTQVVEHHIWFINTVGLLQSVIDSINVIKFKKGEGLIDGAECSVCLSEFEEDENLRLLPKCSHAFHLPCIDTWLRSHKTCPLCRAPIVRESSGSELSSDDLRSTEDPQADDLENSNHLGNGSDLLDVTDSETSSISEHLDETQVEIERTSCDATNHHVPRQEIQQVRRSVSLDFSSASVVYRAMANGVEREVVKSPNSQRAFAKSGSSTSRTSIDEGSSVYRFMKRSLVLKKSLSSNGKFPASSNHKRSQTSLLPL